LLRRDFLPVTGPVDFYQEEVFHAALIGADAFFYFNPWSGYVNGVRATGADHELVAALLSELDLMVGCVTRQWFVDVNIHRWSDSFHLSGALLGDSPNRTAVWRFSPRALPAGVSSPLGMVHDGGSGTLVVSPVLLTNESEPCSLIFAGGAVLQARTARGGSVVAPAGVWIGAASVGGVAVRCSGRMDRSWPLRHHAMKTDDVDTITVRVGESRIFTVLASFVSYTIDAAALCSKGWSFPAHVDAVTTARVRLLSEPGLVIRFGGTSADNGQFKAAGTPILPRLPKVASGGLGQDGCNITASQWRELTTFAKAVNASLVYGINSLLRVGAQPEGTIDLINGDGLMQLAALDADTAVLGFELGK
jgi:hypothetical protein